MEAAFCHNTVGAKLHFVMCLPVTSPTAELLLEKKRSHCHHLFACVTWLPLLPTAREGLVGEKSCGGRSRASPLAAWEGGVTVMGGAVKFFFCTTKIKLGNVPAEVPPHDATCKLLLPSIESK
jgi:hypothetical protein